MAYDPANLSVVAQGARKVWIHASTDPLAKDADAYFVRESASVGDLIIDIDTDAVGAQILVVTAKADDGTLTVADLSSANLT
jgi:hypothetical protein